MAMSYQSIAANTTNPLAIRLIDIILTKRTNLCVSIDVTSHAELLSIIRKVGPHVCMIKTHIDILTSFPSTLVTDLKSLAKEYNFLLFEDRKFADIGNTVSLQYSAGIYCIVEWADIVTVHAVPGPRIVSGLKSVTGGRVRGSLMLAEMSSKGNLCTAEYQSSALSIAKTHADFILGFIAMKPVADGFLTITPGVQLANEGDSLGQVYRDPRDVIRQGSDVIVVGRGITGANDIEATAVVYREQGWKGYLERL